VVHVADRLVAQAGFGFGGDLLSRAPDPESLRALGMRNEVAEGVAADLPRAVADVEATFSAAAS
jgi:hypothetical protein